MNIEEAKAVMLACGEINARLNNVSLVVDKIKDESIQKALRAELGGAMVSIYGGLMRPVIENFPELDPDAEDESLIFK
ncbi:MAG TPA: hypothetical protein VF800_30765 [Telluria sp.]